MGNPVSHKTVSNQLAAPGIAHTAPGVVRSYKNYWR